MRSKRWRLGLIVPAALVLLVAALAALQFRWLGQVSDAERDAMRTNLQRRAIEFTDEFDREISLAYASFAPATEKLMDDDPAPVAAAWAKWKEAARFPEIVRGVYLADGEKGRSTLRQFQPDQGAFVPAEWPASLAPLQASLWAKFEVPVTPKPTPQPLIAVSAPPVVIEAPALVLSVIDRQRIEAHAAATGLPLSSAASAMLREIESRRTVSQDALLSLRPGHKYLIVELDRAVLVDRVLTTLSESHFGSDRYRVSILDNAGKPLLTTTADGAAIQPAQADVVLPFFAVRSTVTRLASGDGRVMAWTSGAAPSGGAVMRTTPLSPAQRGSAVAVPRENSITQFSVIVEGGRSGSGAPGAGFVGRSSAGAVAAPTMRSPRGWQLLLQHSAGSLDNAVARARARNLWLSFGILSVLMAGIGLVVLNARRSERLAAQQMDFVATVSHELRTPLAVIRSAAQNLSAGVVHDAAQAQRYGDLIEAEGRRLTDMVEQVLEYAGLSGNRQNLRARPIDLGAVVQDVMSTSPALFDTDEFTIAVEIDGDVPLVVADEGALRRAVTNLVTNAFKYGSDGRWIGVSLRHVKVRGKSEVQLAVKDRGRGIEPEDLPHIFEAFYRGRYAVDRQIHGNGLGLSLVRRIVEAHGGRVTAQSTPGNGATFTLHLPAAIADSAHQPLSEPAPSAGGQTA